ncbi:gamma-mobile-trio protein GmtX [Pseudoalteromonas sp. S16_S37]|uniref:gamma-mobile-trio protein GmtX n=1 Tax=Pseudoalteromonas sp. S16_S37 TaxID=2720228 RepID=UPI0019347746
MAGKTATQFFFLSTKNTFTNYPYFFKVKAINSFLIDSPNYISSSEIHLHTTRTTNALTVLNAVLEQQSRITPLDFSMATIGRLSKELGGPSTQTIRNRTGKHFQQLIVTLRQDSANK